MSSVQPPSGLIRNISAAQKNNQKSWRIFQRRKITPQLTTPTTLTTINPP
jgi:hypothetical protein